MKATQFVIIAPLTTSNSGNATKTRSDKPTVCNASKKNTTKKSVPEHTLIVLKRVIRVERMNVPISGVTKTKNKHHIHATRSDNEISAW